MLFRTTIAIIGLQGKNIQTAKNSVIDLDEYKPDVIYLSNGGYLIPITSDDPCDIPHSESAKKPTKKPAKKPHKT